MVTSENKPTGHRLQDVPTMRVPGGHTETSEMSSTASSPSSSSASLSSSYRNYEYAYMHRYHPFIIMNRISSIIIKSFTRDKPRGMELVGVVVVVELMDGSV